MVGLKYLKKKNENITEILIIDIGSILNIDNIINQNLTKLLSCFTEASLVHELEKKDWKTIDLLCNCIKNTITRICNNQKK